MSDIIGQLLDERARAQKVLDACDVAIAAFRALEGRPAPGDSIVGPRPLPTPVGARKPRPTTPRKADPSAPPAIDPESKSGKYQIAVLQILGRLGPHYSADSTVLRREVAKRCTVKPGDTMFNGDVSNAIHALKARGQIERSGTVWALTAKEREALGG